MKTLLRYLTRIVAIAVIFLGSMPAAAAHPLGNFTLNHYAGLQARPDGIGIDYVLDMAEIPAFQEIHRLDTNHDRKADSTETVNYPTTKCQEINHSLKLRVNQKPVAIALNHAKVEFPPGVGGLATLRLSCAFEGAIALTNPQQSVEFEDGFYPQRLGWREITVTSQDVPIQGNFTTTSMTKRLRDYPTELLNSPLNQRQVAFQVNSLETAAQMTPQPNLSTFNPLGLGLAGRRNDVFTSLTSLKELNLPTVLISLAIAFVWGGLHALSPGHGKTIVGAYLVGSRSKFQHAFLLGLTVTLTHTAGVFALGLLTLGTSQLLPIEQVYPWLSLVSGVLVTAIGLKLLINRLQGIQILQQWGLKLNPLTPAHAHHSHAHHHHSHAHHHDHSCNHHHHSHDGYTHSHLPLNSDGTSMSWSSLLALGVSGGLLPCPSALVVLLGAIAVGRIGFGLALVSVFSLGLAGVLTAIGLILVYAKHWFEKLQFQSSPIKLLPTMSALLITLIGIGISTQAFYNI
jgi:ABC-type nickel/cobalt efflux system permease component RcnA